MRTAICETSRGEPLVLDSVNAKGTVVGRMLEMTLEQRFRNSERTNVEVVYTFPLPWHAVLLGLDVELNGETLHGVVKAKSAARAEYEEALSEGHSGILVTVNPDRSYTLELGNLMAGESCVVRMRYVQVLQPEQGSLRLMLPTTLAPRYGDAVRDGGFEPHAAHEVSTTAEYPFSIELNIQGELVQAQIGSPSHRITTRTLSGVGTKVDLQTQVKLGDHAWLDRDFVLVFSELPHSSQGLAAWDRLNAGVGVVMASFTPKLTNRQSIPASMKVLVDCSGSMNGDSIQAARSALQSILSTLSADDRFSLSRFGSSVEHRSKALWKVAPASMASAQRWVQTLEADLGGTEMNDAILSTLTIPGAERCDVLLITDGEIHAIEPVLISAKQSGHRFFVVGIGSAVAEGLLRRLAEDTGGSCEFVVGGEQVQPAIQRLFHRLRSPSVQDARIEWPKGCTVHAASKLPASIFDGDDITVFAHLKSAQSEAMTGKVRLLGRMADMQGEVCLAELTPALVSDDASTLARLAANQRYWQLRKRSENTATVADEELRTLAEMYQLVTDDTSLILVKQREAHELAQGMPRLKAVNSMLAAGWGGHGSVEDSQVMFSIAVPDLRFCADSLSSGIGPGATDGSARVLQSKSAPRLAKRGPGRSKKLRAFIDSFDDLPPVEVGNPLNIKLPPQDPTREPEFWNDGDAYSQDRATWRYYEGLTPAGVVEWLRLNPKLRPCKYADLRKMHLPTVVVEWLELVLGHGKPEGTVVTAFAKVVAGYDLAFPHSNDSLPGISESRPATDQEVLTQELLNALAGLTFLRWPAGVVDFAEFEQSIL